MSIWHMVFREPWLLALLWKTIKEALTSFVFLFLDGRQADVSRRNTKPRGENHQNPAKSNSRSPLRNATQDSNVRKSSSVEFKEPLASYRYWNLLMMVGHITWLYLSLMVADLKPFIGSLQFNIDHCNTNVVRKRAAVNTCINAKNVYFSLVGSAWVYTKRLVQC